MQEVDVLVIGAGPSGAIASAILHKNGVRVLVVDKEKFPRFVIGESLLSNCMTFLDEAGMLDVIQDNADRLGFQYKNGAAFSWGDKYTYFEFSDKSSAGFGTTYQVRRSEFDKLIIDTAVAQGVPVRFECELTGIEFDANGATASIKSGENCEQVRARFVIDASGYGRVLPRLLDLERPSALASRKAYFTHITDNISEPLYDRNKILITMHPEHREVWYWLIPFSDGHCSIGVVGEDRFLNIGASDIETLKKHVYDAPMLKRLLGDAVWDTPARSIVGYSKNVKSLCGERYILLGNAGEFLDPVFSSGVTIAMYSASVGAKCVARFIAGEAVDFKADYESDVLYGVEAFKTYVQGWYDGTFQDVIFTPKKDFRVKRHLTSILAGYAWDRANPYVAKSQKALKALHAYV